ncbi:uncharacterized protein BDW47DRAFT_33033 [Aspergillus candidus]|uniref:Nitrogen regulatory protein areA GATA-like domain-containing protein n=1 Tax=Aspergillus candidus TaxID=41067 RepID=A0A2I2FBD7_ASPCN|nr:hypothetical protein BDW47DRAFT_33033 [Aspergillus candidus]PLB37942.1 hypothetical protein BDW47DRAFT_33033 [Aspergillus candidus]
MENLPQGLVSTSTQLPSGLDDTAPIDVDDIVKLWKVYSTNPAVHEGDVGHRLAHFFWRIWGNERIRCSLNGTSLARLFMRIAEHTPSASLTPSTKKEHRPQKPEPSRKLSDNASQTPLQPILKKPSLTHTRSESPKTTRLLLTGEGGSSVTRKPSSNAPTPVLQAQPETTRGKKTYVASTKAKAKSSKRRPVIMRRKSSQASSGTNTRNHSPSRAPTPLTVGASDQFMELEDGEPEVDAPGTESTDSVDLMLTDVKEKVAPTVAPVDPADLEKPVQLPDSFLVDLKDILQKKSPSQSAKSSPPKYGFISRIDDYTHYDARFFKSENYEQPSSASLVDKDFRTRFTERKRQEEELIASSLTTGDASMPINASGGESMESISPTSQGTSMATSSGIPIRTPSQNGSMFSPSGRRTSDGMSIVTPSSKGRSQLSFLLEKSRLEEAMGGRDR